MTTSDKLNTINISSNKYFNNFCKFLKISDEIYLYFAKAYPMTFKYIFHGDDDDEVPEGEEQIKLAFYLAPKISDEDED